MKDLFPQFYRRSDEEFSNLFKKAVFVVDANMLLHLYRYPQAARADLLKILQYLAAQKRLWIPFQVALEFQCNRLEVIASQRNKYGEVKKIINDIQTELKSKLDGLRLRKRHSAIDPDILLGEISASCGKYLHILNRHEEGQLDVYDDDKIRTDVDCLLSDRIGPAFTQTELDSICEDGAKRYKNKRPPGYKDEADKKGSFIFHEKLAIKREFGDLIVWKEIIRFINENKPEGLVFVTDDNKEDWWAELSGKTVGPQPALLSEIKSETGLSEFYIYNAERFMEFANTNFNLRIEKDSIEQVKRISRERSRWSGKHLRLTTVHTILSSLYGGVCQICSRKDTEVTMVVPVSSGGDASIHNTLLLCRDHHQQFDMGLFSIGEDFRLIGIDGFIEFAPNHRLSPTALEYHRQKIFGQSTNDSSGA
jgi:hypothetical protein